MNAWPDFILCNLLCNTGIKIRYIHFHIHRRSERVTKPHNAESSFSTLSNMFYCTCSHLLQKNVRLWRHKLPLWVEVRRSKNRKFCFVRAKSIHFSSTEDNLEGKLPPCVLVEGILGWRLRCFGESQGATPTSCLVIFLDFGKVDSFIGSAIVTLVIERRVSNVTSSDSIYRLLQQLVSLVKFSSLSYLAAYRA